MDNKKGIFKALIYAKKAAVRLCAMFTVFMTLIFVLAPFFIENWDAMSVIKYILLFSAAFGIFSLIFEIEFFPAFARYVLNFILLCAAFVVFFILIPGKVISSETIPIMSSVFAVLYCVSAAAHALFKRLWKKSGGKSVKYVSQFEANDGSSKDEI